MTAPVILCEDRSVIVTVKPRGLDSQSTTGGADMVSALAEHTGGKIYPVHRLDRGTVGVMVYAKTKAAAAALSDAFANGSTDKRYLAVTVGVPAEAEGTYTDLLYHDAKKNKSYVTSRKRSGVREASLSYRVIDTARSGEHTLALVAIKLHTGRTHQIRVQFASRKTPLLGDARYGGVKLSGFAGEPALACVSLSFPHPDTAESMTFTFVPSGGAWELFEKRFIWKL